MQTTIPLAKQRLRDEAELAVMEFVERGGVIRRIAPPVCQPGPALALVAP